MQTEVLKNVSVILPSLNPDEKLKKTVASLLSVGFTDIILVNDGSREDCLAYFPAASDTVTRLTHAVNRGKGAALKTAFAFIKENRPDSVGAVTVDGDGQHAAEDVLHCAEEMVRQKDRVILGCRDFSEPQVPKKSRFGNRITSGVFRLFCGMRVSDTQTGLRAFPSQYYGDMLAIEGDRFEYETNMLLEMKARKIPYAEVRIRTVYIEENKTSHFRPFRDSYRIYSLIIRHMIRTNAMFIKFALSSIAAVAVEILVLTTVTTLFERSGSIDFDINTWKTRLATAASDTVARVVSSFFNFTVNRTIVFRSRDKYFGALLRYYAVALPNLLLHIGLVSLLKNLPFINTPLRISILSFCVTVFLFPICYWLQKKWVFKRKNNG